MAACEILIDTNIVLHFPRIDQVDWSGISGCSECALVITPILLRELEQKKIFGATPALRERAGRMIDYLVARMGDDEPVGVRPGVTLVFMDREPGIDFESHQLVREVNDDHYIAAAIARHATLGLKTMIASNDGGMALKLRSRPVSVLRLPEELRLPLDQDPRDKELRETKEKLVRLETRRPKLAVTFAGGHRRREVRNAKSIPTRASTVAEIKASHPPLPSPTPATGGSDRRPVGDIPALGALRTAFALGGVHAIERYNAELPAFYAAHEDYVSAMNAWIERLRLSAKIYVELHNDGQATATDIDVTLRFPEGIEVCRNRDFPDEPTPPKPPRKPGEGILGDHLASELAFRPPFDLNIHDGAIYVDERRRSVSFSVKSLKQKCVLSPDAFILTRSPGITRRGIEVMVEITLNEGQPVDGKLAITFDDVEVAASDD